MSLLFGPQSSKSEDANRDGAAPLDRFAAGVIDYAIVLMPFIYLILAPFQRAIKVAAVFGTAPAWGIPIITALSVFSVVVMIFLYQTLMVTFWGGTVGQLLLGLRVCNLWDRTKPRFGQSATLRRFACAPFSFGQFACASETCSHKTLSASSCAISPFCCEYWLR